MASAKVAATASTATSATRRRESLRLGRSGSRRGCGESKSDCEFGKPSRIFRQYLFIPLNLESRKRMPNKILVYCAVPSQEVASTIAQTVVREELAACVTVVPGLTSVYRWQGAVESASELLLLIKTREALFEKLRTRILSLHPYEVPEVIATPITQGHAPYLEWIDRSTLKL